MQNYQNMKISNHRNKLKSIYLQLQKSYQEQVMANIDKDNAFNIEPKWRDVAKLEEFLKDVAKLEELLKEDLEREAKRQTGCANAKCKINFIES